MIYVYRCAHCDTDTEIERKIDERDDPAICAVCGNWMKRVFVTPMAQVWAGKFHDRWNQKNPTDGLPSTW